MNQTIIIPFRNFIPMCRAGPNASVDNSTVVEMCCQKLMPMVLAYLTDVLQRNHFLIRPAVLTAFATVAIFGALGNLLVMVAVLHNPKMRMPRNYFIINLALSDFLLCTITVPLTAYLIMNALWYLGETTCKLLSTFIAINTFVSSVSIAAIGMDRYWVIVFPVSEIECF